MIGNPLSEEAPKEQANSHSLQDTPFFIDVLDAPVVYSSDTEMQLQAWEYDQLGSEMEQFMEQLEYTSCESALAPSGHSSVHLPSAISSRSSASSSNPSDHHEGPQEIIPVMFDHVTLDNGGMELYDEVSLPLPPELLIAYSSMLADIGPSTMPGVEFQAVDLSYLNTTVRQSV